MAVQQHVLNWLYSILTSEYHDVNRTYSDVASVLAQYPSLSPRTDAHTFDNGTSALLLHLSGTIPVLFRGTTYRFPVAIWVPHAYPREPPLVYVTPNESMIVRPGQHVDPQGRVYHPYLTAWPGFWDKSSLLDLLGILRDVFAKEPPVVARPQGPGGQTPAQAPVAPTPPPILAHPPTSASSAYQREAQTPNHGDRPPPPPPKGDQGPQRAGGTSGPPLPPLPPGLNHRASQQSPYSGHPAQSPQSAISRYDRPPPLPHQQGHQPQPQGYHQQPPQPQAQHLPPQQQGYPPQQQPQAHHPGVAQPNHQSPVSQQHGQPPYQQGHPPPFQPQHGQASPQDPRHGSIPVPHQPQQIASPGPIQNQQAPAHSGPPPQNWQAGQHPQQHPQQHQQPPPPHPFPPHIQPRLQPQPQVQHRAPPAPDIMDAPLTLSLPQSTTITAPPIPPNPEKDALLQQLASTLYTLRQQAQHQNTTSLAGLQSQKSAMLAALQNLQSDAASLQPISHMLSSNTAILQSSLREADLSLQNIRNNHQKPPPIDDLLVAPTVVGNQLYDLVAEERALGDAIFILGRSVERGNLSPQVFAKTTRSLAREWYLKKALVRKIGRGMGLIV